MNVDFDLAPGIVIKLASDRMQQNTYPTGRIQKGLLLVVDGQDLSEEAVGFGVPIIKRGLYTIFPGELELIPQAGSPINQMKARFKLNLEERLARSGSATLNNPLLYASKNNLALLIRRSPSLRATLTKLSNLLRSAFHLKTTYEPSRYSSTITLNYTINPAAGKIRVELEQLDRSVDGITEVIVMNELGAHYFDRYHDSDGVAQIGDEIGCWDPVSAQQATFTSNHHRISFSLPHVEGALLYRGRELIGERLAWSGFGYSFPPILDHFSYEITINRGL
jgi:hypothetical protein